MIKTLVALFVVAAVVATRFGTNDEVRAKLFRIGLLNFVEAHPRISTPTVPYVSTCHVNVFFVTHKFLWMSLSSFLFFNDSACLAPWIRKQSKLADD
jgi:hypothetical protein